MSVFPRANEVTMLAVEKAYEKMSYTFFTKGNYNLNIFGIRTNDNTANTFNDLVGLAYFVDEMWRLNLYDATTDPGIYYRLNPMAVSGTAILVPGYYKGAFTLGKHQGSYEALVQNKPLTVWRDVNKDNVLDFSGKTETGMFGINLHRATANAGTKSSVVDKWSAGCQVIAGYDGFIEMMEIVKKSSKLFGSTFSYALFTENEFFGK